MCLLKIHFSQFHKIQYVLKIVKMILKLKMSLFNINSKFSTVYENCGKCLCLYFQYKTKFFKIVEGVSWRDTFNLSQFPKNGIILKVSLQDIPSIILKKLGLYWKCFFKRHSLQFSFTVENFEFILKRDNFSFKIISTIFKIYWILWNWCDLW